MGGVRKLHMPSLFRVDIDGYDSKMFEYAGPFDMDVGESKTRDGTSALEVKEPNGMLTCADVELRRPMADDMDLYNWFKEVLDAAANTGETPDSLKRTIDVVQLNQLREEVMTWRLQNAWPKGYRGGEQNVETERAKTETVVLSVEYIERLPS